MKTSIRNIIFTLFAVCAISGLIGIFILNPDADSWFHSVFICAIIAIIGSAGVIIVVELERIRAFFVALIGICLVKSYERRIARNHLARELYLMKNENQSYMSLFKKFLNGLYDEE